MKKLVFICFSLVLMAAMGIELIACSSSSSQSTSSPSATPESTKVVNGIGPTQALPVTPPDEGAPIPTTYIVPPLEPGSDNKLHACYSAGSGCDAIFYVGIHKGIFKKYGLDITWGKSSDMNAIATGKFDVGNTVVQGTLVPILNGLNLKMTLGYHQGCVSSITLPDSPYKTWKDLKGKTVGFGGAFGSGTQLYAYRLVIAEGLDPAKDINWKVYPDQASAIVGLNKNEIQVCVGSDTMHYLEVINERARWFSYMATDPIYQGESCCLVMFNGDFVKNHPEVTRVFTAACYEATLWIKDNLAETVQIEIGDKYINRPFIDVYNYLRLFPYEPGYDIGYRTIYNNTVDFIKGGIMPSSTNPKEFTDNIMFYCEGIPN
jgi:NitT/TauT family transport system substrate-binding protein